MPQSPLKNKSHYNKELLHVYLIPTFNYFSCLDNSYFALHLAFLAAPQSYLVLQSLVTLADALSFYFNDVNNITIISCLPDLG